MGQPEVVRQFVRQHRWSRARREEDPAAAPGPPVHPFEIVRRESEVSHPRHYQHRYGPVHLHLAGEGIAVGPGEQLAEGGSERLGDRGDADGVRGEEGGRRLDVRLDPVAGLGGAGASPSLVRTLAHADAELDCQLATELSGRGGRQRDDECDGNTQQEEQEV